ncbi:hypothetical protein [Daejeonella oryzae]|uniref:hypothetical protein n=1 Tax=Daejeonella oryzae TaxID=1122943 RepID=UPI00047C658F|nr:hypothetical protein [Daejeonella oryzae]
MKNIFLIILFFLFALLGCITKKAVISKNIFESDDSLKEIDTQFYNCNGFVIDKSDGIKKDSVYLNVNISSCIDGLTIPYASLWIKSNDGNYEKKFTCNKFGKITIPLKLGYYTIQSSSVHFNTVKTPLLTLYPVNYNLKIYLGGGDPIID